MTEIPDLHKEDSVKLNPKDLYHLFEITLTGGTIIRLHAGSEIVWDGKTFEAGVISLDGTERNSGQRRIRPTLNMQNPAAIFHVPVAQGLIDNASVVLYKVHPDNLLVVPATSERNEWYIAQVTGLSKNSITAELRGLADRQETLSPPRQYLRPDFPSVTI